MSKRLNFVLDDVVVRAFPGHATGLVRIRSEVPVAAQPDAILDLMTRYRAAPEAAMAAATRWSGVYKTMGAKPKHACSVERLREMEAGHGRLPIPVPVVEFYCWFSLVSGIPMAGYRPDRITGDLKLTMPGAGVPFTALGQPNGSQEATKPREVAYVDAEKAICRYWNYRDCDQTKLVSDLTDVVFVFDLVDTNTARFAQITAEFASYLQPVEISAALACGNARSVAV
jgi:DNA/RNA-binding domain of Phe-tRNA-synthetase-like protein